MFDDRDPVKRLGDRLDDAFVREERAAAKTRRRRRLRAVIPATVVLTCAAAAFAAADRGGSANIVTVDQAVAAVAQAAYDAAPPRDGYLYTRTRRTWTMQLGFEQTTAHVTASNERDAWQAPDYSGWTRTRTVALGFPSSHERLNARRLVARAKREERRLGRQARGVDVFAMYAPLAAALDNRPADPDEVVCKVAPSDAPFYGGDAEFLVGPNPPDDAGAVYRTMMRRARGYAGADRIGMIWNSAVEALGGGYLRLEPAQRAALVGALARIPGVHTLGRVDDPNGRPSIGFWRDWRNRRSTIYFDAGTALVSYTEDTQVRPAGRFEWHVPRGTVFDRYELLDYRAANPPAGLSPTAGAQDGLGHLVSGGCPSARGHYMRAVR